MILSSLDPPGVAWQTPKYRPNESDLGFLVSKTVGEYFSIIVSQQVCGNFLQQPQQINTHLIHVSLKTISLPISVHTEENGYFNHSQMYVYSYSICTYYASIYMYIYYIYDTFKCVDMHGIYMDMYLKFIWIRI